MHPSASRMPAAQARATSEGITTIIHSETPGNGGGRGCRAPGNYPRTRGITPHGLSRPAVAPATHLPKEESGGSDPQRYPPTRFRDGACHPAGSLSKSALPPDASEREMAEDGELESQRPVTPARFPAVARPCRVHPPGRRAEGTIPTAPGSRALASSEARPPGRFTLQAPPPHPASYYPRRPTRDAVATTRSTLTCAGRESNPHVRRHTLLRRARLPSAVAG